MYLLREKNSSYRENSRRAGLALGEKLGHALGCVSTVVSINVIPERREPLSQNE
jgi:hypothetical protein